MTKLIKLPKAFFIDHEERDLDTPEVLKETKTNIWVSADDPHLDELMSDAEYYSDMADMGAWGKHKFGLIRSAKATIRAIQNAQ